MTKKDLTTIYLDACRMFERRCDKYLLDFNKYAFNLLLKKAKSYNKQLTLSNLHYFQALVKFGLF